MAVFYQSKHGDLQIDEVWTAGLLIGHMKQTTEHARLAIKKNNLSRLQAIVSLKHPKEGDHCLLFFIPEFGF